MHASCSPPPGESTVPGGQRVKERRRRRGPTRNGDITSLLTFYTAITFGQGSKLLLLYRGGGRDTYNYRQIQTGQSVVCCWSIVIIAIAPCW